MTVLICVTAFIASTLTFFSGFGLGTLLLPMFAAFFPVQEAVALTAVVHFLNNIFKVGLVGKHASKRVLFKFGITALIFSFVGAKLLGLTSNISALFYYTIGEKFFQILPVNLIIAILIFLFTLIELIPKLNHLSVHAKYLSIGGAISGFFGGFSGHQGALRSMFLSKLNLSKESFIATGVVIALLIDIPRLTVYSADFSKTGFSENGFLLTMATLSAVAGTLVGKRRLKKLTMEGVQKIVAVTLLLFSIALGAGLI